MGNRQVVVPLWGPPLPHTIAMLDSQIGWLDGLLPRKRGVAKMLARAAPQQQEGVLDLDFAGRLDYTGALACVRHLPALRNSRPVYFGTGLHGIVAMLAPCAIFWCWGLSCVPGSNLLGVLCAL